MKKWLVLFLCPLLVTFALAAVKESKANKTAKGSKITKGASIAILVSQKKYSIQPYKSDVTAGDQITVYSWSDPAFMANGSNVVLKEFVSQLKQMGFKPYLIDQPSLYKQGSYLINPRLKLRTTKLKSRSVKWDGVSTSVPIKKGLSGDYKWSGSGKGISINLNVYDPAGKWLITSYGGVAVPFYSNMREVENRLKDEIYDESSLLTKGIKSALSPIKKVQSDNVKVEMAESFKRVSKAKLKYKMHKCAYKRYLNFDDHKAFFVGDKGSVGYVYGSGSISSAIKEAKASCEQYDAIENCELYDMDGEKMVNDKDIPRDLECHPKEAR